MGKLTITMASFNSVPEEMIHIYIYRNGHSHTIIYHWKKWLWLRIFHDHMIHISQDLFHLLGPEIEDIERRTSSSSKPMCPMKT